MKERVVVKNWDKTSLITDPTRRQLLERLITEELSAKDVAKELNISQQLANYHLQKLLESGLAEGTEERRGQKNVHIYRAVAREFEFAPLIIGPQDERKRKSGDTSI